MTNAATENPPASGVKGAEELADDGAAALRVLLARPDVDAKRYHRLRLLQSRLLDCAAGDFAATAHPPQFLVSISGPTVTVEDEGFAQYSSTCAKPECRTVNLAKALPLLKLDNSVGKVRPVGGICKAQIAKDKDQPVVQGH